LTERDCTARLHPNPNIEIRKFRQFFAPPVRLSQHYIGRDMSNQTIRENRETEIGRATDGQLLKRFVDGNDSEAFSALVCRYSGLVMSLCRRTLGDEHSAEDAFQATFLVLARKASRIRNHASLASWLYAVAYRTARRAQADRHNRREQALLDEMMDPDDTLGQIASRYEQQLLDEELQQLAAKYREPLVLRYLMGKPNREVATELGLPLGVVEGRLKRAKDKLRQRLARRGVSAACAMTVIAASAAETLAADSLVAVTVNAATAIRAGTAIPEGVSEGAIRLCERELMMKVSTLATTTATVTVVALAIAGFAFAQSDGLGQEAARAAEAIRTTAAATAEVNNKIAILPADPQEADTDPFASPLTGEKKIEAALQEKGDAVYDEKLLGVVMQEIALQYDINVVIDHRALDDVGLNGEVPITSNLSDLPLQSRLTLMLHPLDLTWTIHEGVLLITTPEESEDMGFTRVYEVSDLIKFQDKDGEEWAHYDTLIELITSTIRPDSWDDVGGAGAIESAPFGNAEMLTIYQTYQIHKKVEALLTSLRQFTKQKQTEELPIREQPDWGTSGMFGGMGGMGGGMGGGGGVPGGAGGVPEKNKDDE
jgi:RNA polymerase sigma factor (sigma-70 family)